MQLPKKKTYRQTMIYKTKHRKLIIEQNEPHQKQVLTQMLRNGRQFLLKLSTKTGVNSDAPEW